VIWVAVGDGVQPSYSRQERVGRLSVWVKLAQGVGAIPDTIKNWVFQTFVLLFYSQILGVDALLVALALSLSIIVDAITDPWIGSVSDNLHTKWGRRHPMMLLGAVPVGVCFYLVFTPPDGLSHMELFAWLTGFMVLTRVSLSVYFVPWAAIAAELSDDYNERTSVMAYRYGMGWLIGVTFPFIVFGFVMANTPEHPAGQLNPDNYPTMALIGAILMTSGALATTFLTRSQIPYLRQHAAKVSLPSIGQTLAEFRRGLENEQFRLLFVIVLISSAITGTTANMSIYMATFFWQFTSDDLRWFALIGVGALLAFPVLAVLQRRMDKKHILLMSASLSLFAGVIVVVLRFLDLLPENGSKLLLTILVVDGAVFAMMEVIRGVIGASLIADILDQHELKTGYRQEAMFNSAIMFCIKATSGLGILFGGVILSLIALPVQSPPASVPAQTIFNLGFIVGICLPLLHVFPIMMIRRYKITRDVHAEIRRALEERRRGDATS
jgi:GPH family glycoside/pentoside/hexuronide:cation symporter